MTRAKKSSTTSGKAKPTKRNAAQGKKLVRLITIPDFNIYVFLFSITWMDLCIL